jgi:hypothetical protein
MNALPIPSGLTPLYGAGYCLDMASCLEYNKKRAMITKKTIPLPRYLSKSFTVFPPSSKKD